MVIGTAPSFNGFVFGKEWWNGYFICPNCLYNALTSPTLTHTGPTVVYNPKSTKPTYINEVGAYIKGPVYVNQNF